MLMSRKAAIELSVNFLVMTIISIVVFGLGLVLAKNIFSGSTELSDKAFEQLDQGIDKLACATGERVCLSTKQKTVQRGEFSKIALSVENILKEPAGNAKDAFQITISHPNAVDAGDRPIPDRLEWLPHQRMVEIPRQSTMTMGVGINVPDDAASGTYVFDATVSANGAPYHQGMLYRFYISVP
ncbi:hypothetical protein HYU19_05715 [Candidatus Woesearchaeota archaeon]|nr:hypothetical protein [Candidatus Woesearchaeota archaeon]